MPTPSPEPIIDPDRPIIDAHHHLWLVPEAAIAGLEDDESQYTRLNMPNFRARARYLLEEFLAEIDTGHNVRATVYVEAHAMYRREGPAAMRSVGEVEFAAGTAAMAESGVFGDVRVCAGIIGAANLKLGEAVEDVLAAHMAASGGRYRGVRNILMYDEDTHVLTHRFGNTPNVAADPMFRAGFSRLAPLGLTFDAWMLEPQLPELVDLARAFPETTIVVCHTGGPVGIGRFTGKLSERYPIWRARIAELADLPNVVMKIGGLGMPNTGFATSCAAVAPTSDELAADWRPYVEGCIEAFGADRCMFESNFPPDGCTTTYPVLWNALKRTVSGASEAEKTALFSGTAARIYRVEV